ncbi:hypothetical protein MUO14_10865 [Halobacillus shinanisalinarum]|uniref:DUF4362 domain-containing protein n=1 Tax=Halobacillus shinanisalinarum TaxID=2932258 RepID=A0ABY4H4J2_9BACI|nr:hypothetical protein [Halobacillus shinanisalinarum]UOQ95382.1 hypothetical protein MUO14_10865 [Halobacillus shinanisalinarum]
MQIQKNYSIDDAKENGDVIVEHQVDSFDQIVQCALKLQNISKMLNLIDGVEQKKEDSVDISIFQPDGTHYKNTISYDGEVITFENNYGGYKQTPAGTFECEHISKRGPIIYLNACKENDGTKHSTMIGFIGTEEAYKQAQH